MSKSKIIDLNLNLAAVVSVVSPLLKATSLFVCLLTLQNLFFWLSTAGCICILCRILYNKLFSVRGNVDRESWTQKIPATNVLEVGGISIYILHDLAELDLKPEAAGFAVVVYGHTHKSKQETKNGVLYFNPGSAGPRRFTLPVTVGRLIVEGGSVRGEILHIVDQ